MSTIGAAAAARARATTAINIALLAPGDAARLVEITLTLARHGVIVVGSRGPYLVLRLTDRAPRALAVALRRSFADLGPAFVKFGQLVASSPGLFPKVLADEMRKLLDDVPPEPSGRVRAVLEHELGRPLAEVFSSFDDTPIAAASIAQVHRATLHDGTEVAVKIRRPRLRSRIRRDVRLLRLLATVFERAGTIGELANPVAIVDDFAATLRRELDFRNEADAMARFARNLRSHEVNAGVVTPELIPGMVSERMIVMTFIEGVAVDRAVAAEYDGIDWEDVIRRAVRAWMHGLLEFGFFHGDVHAGNLFVTPGGQLAFLDFGIVGDVEEGTRGVLRDALPAVLIERDFGRVVEALFDLGAATGPVDVEAATDDVRDLVTPLLSRPLSEISYGEMLSQILQVATRHRVRLPREMVLIVKQLLYFERYAKELAPNYQILGDAEILGFLLSSSTPAGASNGDSSPPNAPATGEQ